ncbi:MAG TPA: hypothetical protein EYP14_07375, partial [Planctomycetaceae bacterium]|nr:hypothetical protein [Planctomycetaceae bacterium]
PVQEHIRATFQLLDQPPDPATRGELRRYEVQHISARIVANAISGIYRLNSRVQAFADTTAGTVAVLAPAREHEQIAKIVEQLDRPSANEPVERLYRPQHISPDSLIKTLQTLYGYSSYRRTNYARFSADRTTQSIVAIASPELHKKIEQTVKLLDQPPDPSTRGEIKRYTLQHISPETITQAIENYFRDEQRVQVVAEPEASTITVIAPASVHQELQKLIAGLDKPSEMEPVEQVYRPQHMDPQAMLDALESLYGTGRYASSYRYRYSRYGRSGGRAMSARFTLDRATRSIIAVAPPPLQQKIKATFELLDQPPDPALRGEMKRYAIRYVEPAQAASAISGIYRDDPRVQVFADTTASMLMVVAPQQEQEEIAKLISELDQKSEVQRDRVIHVFNLSEVDPYSAYRTLRDAFLDVPLRQRPFIESETDPDRLVVRATPEQIDQMRKLLVQLGEDPLLLDAEAAKGAKVRAIAVRRGSPRALA